MKIIGFNFSKISIEKISDDLKGLKINTSINLKEVKQIKQSPFQTKEDLLEIKFKYNIDYDPNLAKISFLGTVLIMVDSKTSKEFLKEWKKKKLPEAYRTSIINVVMKKSNLKALALEDEMGLPLHIPLPSIKE